MCEKKAIRGKSQLGEKAVGIKTSSILKGGQGENAVRSKARSGAHHGQKHISLRSKVGLGPSTVRIKP